MKIWLPLLLAIALPAAACGDDDGDENGTDTLDPIVCENTTATSDPCAGETCFTACGVQILIDAAPAATGLAPDLAPTRRPDRARRAGLAIIGVNPYEVQGLNPETAALEGTVRFPGVPAAIASVDFAAAGQIAVLQSGDGVLYPLSLSDLSVPRAAASWRPTGDVAVIEGTADRLFLRTPTGVSVIDATDLDAPTEISCIATPVGTSITDFWDVDVDSDFIVMSGGDPARAFVFDQLRPEQPAFPLPIDTETSVTLYKDWMVVTLSGKTVRYALNPGVAPTRTTGSDTLIDAFNPTVSGGFLVFGDSAFDLDNDLKEYEVVAGDANVCTVSLNAVDRSDAFIIAPTLAPDVRYPADAIPPLICPPATEAFAGSTAGARSGTKVALSTAAGLTFVDLIDASSETQPATPGALAYIGATVVGIEQTGTDFGMPLSTILHSRLAAGGGDATADLERPLVAWAAGTSSLWFVVEGAPRNFGDDAPEPDSNVVLRVDPATGLSTSEVSLPKGTQPIGVAAAGNRIFVIDARRRVHAIDADGTEVFSVETPQGFGGDAVASTSMGVFFGDACSALTWIDNEGVVRNHNPDTTLKLSAAEQFRLYTIAESDAGHPDVAGGPVMLVYVPSAQGEAGFTLDESARVPVPNRDTVVLPGAPVAMVSGSLYTLVTPE
ncbi:MAG: hypothetical protein ACI9MR_002186 [Myxococcota bacterium]|jgi:hypothetical protein